MTPSATMVPDARGRFGEFGGRYVPETLMHAMEELTAQYETARQDATFQQELEYYLKHYVGRPSPLYFAQRLTEHCGGARIYVKREDLNHTGAHKINNTIGQALLTRRMGKPRVIAETGAGQHGVATATACALFGLECVVYMGEEDVRRQRLNVFNMKTLGAEVRPVASGSRTLRDAINEAMRDWMGSVGHTHYCIGSVVGPHPFPVMVRDFQSVIGRETRAQCLEQIGRLPDVVVACVGGGSNAAGMFYPFVNERSQGAKESRSQVIDETAPSGTTSLDSSTSRPFDPSPMLIGVEAGGSGAGPGEHASTLCYGAPGVLHGSFSFVMQDEDGQTLPVHSISAGLDYPGVGPEHSYWKETGRVTYTNATDAEALEAFGLLARLEGIQPALESAHAVAHAAKVARERSPEEVVVICLSGRGDKDAYEVARLRGEEI